MKTTPVLPSQISSRFPLHLIFHMGLDFSCSQLGKHARAIQRSHANAYLSPITPNTAGLRRRPLKGICFVLNIFTLENISRERGEPFPRPLKAAVCRILIVSSLRLMPAFDVPRELCWVSRMGARGGQTQTWVASSEVSAAVCAAFLSSCVGAHLSWDVGRRRETVKARP